jgi:hypothetical protein
MTRGVDRVTNDVAWGTYPRSQSMRGSAITGLRSLKFIARRNGGDSARTTMPRKGRRAEPAFEIETEVTIGIQMVGASTQRSGSPRITGLERNRIELRAPFEQLATASFERMLKKTPERTVHAVPGMPKLRGVIRHGVEGASIPLRIASGVAIDRQRHRCAMRPQWRSKRTLDTARIVHVLQFDRDRTHRIEEFEPAGVERVEACERVAREAELEQIFGLARKHVDVRRTTAGPEWKWMRIAR